MDTRNESPSPADDTLVRKEHRHTVIGFTEWMAIGLLAFTLLLVILAVVINLFLGTPGGLGIEHAAAPL